MSENLHFENKFYSSLLRMPINWPTLNSQFLLDLDILNPNKHNVHERLYQPKCFWIGSYVSFHDTDYWMG